MMPQRMLMNASNTGAVVEGNWSNYDTTNNKAAVQFASGCSDLAITPISATKFIIAYMSGTTLYAKVGSISGNGTITFGSEIAIIAEAATNIDCKVLGDGVSVVFSYVLSTSCKVIAATISGTSLIDITSAITVNTSSLTSGQRRTRLAPAAATNGFYVAYGMSNVSGTYIRYCTLTSGTLATVSAELRVSAVTPNALDMTYFTAAIPVYMAIGQGGANDCNGQKITGTSTLSNTINTILNGTFTVGQVNCEKITDTTAFVSFSEQFSPLGVQAAVQTESGGTFTTGTLIQVDSTIAEYLTGAIPDATHAMVAWGVNTVSVRTCVVNISGNSLVAGTVYPILTGNYNYITCCACGSQSIPLAYTDAGASNNGYIINLRP